VTGIEKGMGLAGGLWRRANVHVASVGGAGWIFAMWDLPNVQLDSAADFVWMFVVWDCTNIHPAPAERSTWMFAWAQTPHSMLRVGGAGRSPPGGTSTSHGVQLRFPLGCSPSGRTQTPQTPDSRARVGRYPTHDPDPRPTIHIRRLTADDPRPKQPPGCTPFRCLLPHPTPRHERLADTHPRSSTAADSQNRPALRPTGLEGLDACESAGRFWR
jgi:hypothetical protein